ncbi:MAG: hypothetical protein HDT10_01230 [Helicobacter sp.]|nr:hypothetical protein [Helicobacter sp.]
MRSNAEVIYNPTKFNLYNGILKTIQNYGLPRLDKSSLAMTQWRFYLLQGRIPIYLR